jgi:hypothetical protein
MIANGFEQHSENREVHYTFLPSCFDCGLSLVRMNPTSLRCLEKRRRRRIDAKVWSLI